MILKLNWETKYNLYMRYKLGEAPQKILEEIKKFDNINFKSVEQFEHSLNYWGNTYNEKRLFFSDSWMYKLNLEAKKINGVFRTKNSSKPKPKKKDYSDYTKEELIEIIKIHEDFIEWMKDKDKTSKSKVFDFIYKNFNNYKISIKKLCRSLKVSYEGFRKWKLNGCSIEPKFNQQWLDIIHKAFNDNNQNFGRSRLRYVLKSQYNLKINDNTLYRYMKKLGICSMTKNWKNKNERPKEYKYTKNVIPNLINSNFKTTKPNQKWFIDESYIELPKGEWIYICAIIDSYNNEIVGYQVDDYKYKWIALYALQLAIKNRNVKNVILHSDRGMIYSSKEFRKFCLDHSITQSMNDKSVSTQNRPIEYWFSILKCEYLRLLPISKRKSSIVKTMMISYVEHYNKNRFQQCLGWKSPTQFN